jgi:hypothetical protein
MTNPFKSPSLTPIVFPSPPPGSLFGGGQGTKPLEPPTGQKEGKLTEKSVQNDAKSTDLKGKTYLNDGPQNPSTST